MSIATGRPLLQEIVASSRPLKRPSSLWKRPAQRLWAGEAAAQESFAVEGFTPPLPTKVYRSASLLPVKVPVTPVKLPTDGNEPEYRVGICAAARAATESAAAPAAAAIVCASCASHKPSQ